MLEKALGKRLNTTRIETHIEPEDRLCAPENALPFDADLHYVRAAVDSILPEFPMVSNVHDLRLSGYGVQPEDFGKNADNAFDTMGGLFRADPRPLTREHVIGILEDSYK